MNIHPGNVDLALVHKIRLDLVIEINVRHSLTTGTICSHRIKKYPDSAYFLQIAAIGLHNFHLYPFNQFRIRTFLTTF